MSKQKNAKEILGTTLGIETSSVPDDASMETLAEWDSLAHMRIILRLEEVLGRTLATEEILSVVDLIGICCLLSQNNIGSND